MTRRRALTRRDERIRSAPIDPPTDDVIGILPAPGPDWQVQWFQEGEHHPCIGFVIYASGIVRPITTAGVCGLDEKVEVITDKEILDEIDRSFRDLTLPSV